MDIHALNLGKLFQMEQDKLPDEIETERLRLEKVKIDITNVLYNIYLKATKEVKIGRISILFDGEIWYQTFPEYQRNGYMTEAMKKILELNKERHYHLSIEKKNKASQKFAKKLGFQKVDKVKNGYIYR